jgi:hypothetical protein
LPKADPKSLSDEALSQVCAPTQIEERLLRAGCLGSLAALALLLVTLLAYGDLAHPLFLGPALTVVALFWAHHLVRRPKRRYREELAYRQGLGPWPQYVAEAEVILRRREADWVLLFTRRGLPHGGFWWLRLALVEGPPESARAYLRVLPRWEGPVFKRVEREVPEAIVRDLLSLLKGLDLAALTGIPARVIDGQPCGLTVLRREPWCVTSASCNLGGLTGELLRHPTASLCTKLWDIAWRLSPLL